MSSASLPVFAALEKLLQGATDDELILQKNSDALISAAVACCDSLTKGSSPIFTEGFEEEQIWEQVDDVLTEQLSKLKSRVAKLTEKSIEDLTVDTEDLIAYGLKDLLEEEEDSEDSGDESDLDGSDNEVDFSDLDGSDLGDDDEEKEEAEMDFAKLAGVDADEDIDDMDGMDLDGMDMDGMDNELDFDGMDMDGVEMEDVSDLEEELYNEKKSSKPDLSEIDADAPKKKKADSKSNKKKKEKGGFLPWARTDAEESEEESEEEDADAEDLMDEDDEDLDEENDESEVSSDEEEDKEEEKKDQKKDEKKKDDSSKTSFAALLARDQRLKDELSELEYQLVKQKGWHMMGEAHGKDRETNSLLGINIQLPQYKKADMRGDTQMPDSLSEEMMVGSNTSASALTKAIEQIVVRRIKDVNFDDVLRKAPPPPKKRAGEEEEEVLDFNKSKAGLADLYEADFRENILNETSATDEKTQKKYEEITQLFAKLSFRLDSLANHRHSGRPASIGTSKTSLSSMQVEENVPVTMGMNSGQAPEEMYKKQHELRGDELSRDDKAALRQANKQRRKKGVLGNLAEGRITVEQVKARREKLDEKNKEQKQDRIHMKSVGLTAKQSEREKLRLNKKINGNELLAQASERQRRK